MAQTRLYDFGETLTSTTFLALTRNLILPGIYSGFDATIVDDSRNDTVQIEAGSLLMPNGVLISETSLQRFKFELPSDVNSSINYLIICRHRIKNIIGGTPAEFMIIQNTPESLAAATDSSDDPASPWAYLVVAYIYGVTHEGLKAEGISTPKRVINALGQLVSGVVLRQDRIWAVPFKDGVAVRSPSGIIPLPELKKVPIASVPISRISNAIDLASEVGGTTTVFCAGPHGLPADGDETDDIYVTISGCSNPAYNNIVGPVTVTSVTDFTFPQPTPQDDGSALDPNVPFVLTATPFFKIKEFNVTRQLFYDITSASLIFSGIIPNGMIPDAIYLVAKNATSGDSTIDLTMTDAAGQKVTVNPGSGDPKKAHVVLNSFSAFGLFSVPVQSFNSRFVIEPTHNASWPYGTFPVDVLLGNDNTSKLSGVLTIPAQTIDKTKIPDFPNATFPAYGTFAVNLEISNVSLAGVILSFSGTNPSLTQSTLISGSGTINEVHVSP